MLFINKKPNASPPPAAPPKGEILAYIMSPLGVQGVERH